MKWTVEATPSLTVSLHRVLALAGLALAWLLVLWCGCAAWGIGWPPGIRSMIDFSAICGWSVVGAGALFVLMRVVAWIPDHNPSITIGGGRSEPAVPHAQAKEVR